MDEQEKRELLKRIQTMRIQAKAKLHQLAYLSKATDRTFDKEVNAMLDRLKSLDELENELRTKSK